MAAKSSYPRRTLLFAGGSLLLPALVGCGAGGKLPAPVAAADVAKYPGNVDPPLLVSATWVGDRIAQAGDSLVLLDASELADYRSGHLPGAVHAWWQDTMDPNGPVYGTVLKPDENASDSQRLRRNLLEDLGVDPMATIVLYDNLSNRYATRLLWVLRFLGYPNASLLDGGLAAWRGIDGAIDTSSHSARDVAEPPVSPQQGFYTWKEKVIERLPEPASLIVDIRTDAERSDDIDGTIEPGSIPSSRRVPWDAMLNVDTGRLLDPESLAKLFADAGVDSGRTVVLYGRFGLEATLSWLALKLLAFPDVLIYDGGWAEWALDPSTPKEAIATS